VARIAAEQAAALGKASGNAAWSLAIGLIGSGLARAMNPPYTTVLTPAILALVYLAGAAAVFGLVAARRHLDKVAAGGPEPTPAVVEQRPALREAEPAAGEVTARADEPAVPGDPLLRRAAGVLGASARLDLSEVEYEPDGRVGMFTVAATSQGGFAKESVQEALFTKVTKSISTTPEWLMELRLDEDRIAFRRKKPFRQLIAPPLPEFVAANAADALAHYPDVRLLLGEDSNQQPLAINLKKYPHAAVVGGTGAGKSVFMRTIIELYRAAGWMIVIVDGKTTDYSTLIGLPNVVAVSQSPADHLRLTRYVADEVRSRQVHARGVQFSGSGGSAFTRPPMLFLIDEFASAQADVGGAWDEDLKYITRIARQFKVHLILASQELYRDTIDSKLLENMALRISLGPPSDKTIMEVFHKSLRDEAKRIGGTITKKNLGRGLAVMESEAGERAAIEFQGYYGYSPADPEERPAELAADHEAYRTQVSDQIPKLYPRIAWEIEGPLDVRDLKTIYDLPVINLDGPDGNPLPDRTQFDPSSPDYIGNVGATQAVTPTLEELAEGAEFTRPRRRDADDAAELDDDTTYLPPGESPCNSLYIPPQAPPRPPAAQPGGIDDDPAFTPDWSGIAQDAAARAAAALAGGEKVDLPWDDDDDDANTKPVPRPRKNTGHVPL